MIKYNIKKHHVNNRAGNSSHTYSDKKSALVLCHILDVLVIVVPCLLKPMKLFFDLLLVFMETTEHGITIFVKS